MVESKKQNKRVRIKKDKDGTPLIILDQNMVYTDKDKIFMDLSKFNFPRDKFGNIIYPKKGEKLKVEAEFEEIDGEWVEV